YQCFHKKIYIRLLDYLYIRQLMFKRYTLTQKIRARHFPPELQWFGSKTTTRKNQGNSRHIEYPIMNIQQTTSSFEIQHSVFDIIAANCL
ncbi:MAG: hypothetical protein M3N14_09890, partial [Bacteroidota bacterium]|nr:hypothetical protein [Bacteroidota bacterium]